MYDHKPIKVRRRAMRQLVKIAVRSWCSALGSLLAIKMGGVSNITAK